MVEADFGSAETLIDQRQAHSHSIVPGGFDVMS
jgi:hypothetical protein